MKYLKQQVIPLSLFYIIVISGCSEFKSHSEAKEGIQSESIFQLLSPQSTGIHFINKVTENEQYNHLLWSHVYSGAGVAVGDINNDGLMDIFFAGNQVNDALYLNKGNLKFEEISQSSGILNDNKWSTGATFADVNGDGYDDIYVCRMGQTSDRNNRKNLLYINNGDLTFTELGKEYGLDDGGFSIQSTFFDMDRDGDLDMFLINQPPDPRLVSRFNIDPMKNPELYRDKLFLNTGDNSFIEIAKSAGVDKVAYGLNVVASDLNNDGWVDLYVSNDYDDPDFLYINNGNMSFTNSIDEAVKHISNFAMGSDVADIDNDGLLDIGVVDMAASDHFRSKTNMGSMRPDRFWSNVKNGKHYQYMNNTLQRNNGNGTFSEIAQLAGISKTDWSWGILMADFDNDSYKDITITNGIQRDIRNNDFQYKIKQANLRGIKDFKILDVVNMVPSNPISNYMFKGNGEFTFSNVTKPWGFDHPGFSHGIAYADLDDDGDLDLVLNNQATTAGVYENIYGNTQDYIRFKLIGAKGNPHALNAQIQIKYGSQSQIIEITATRGYMSASEPIAHFGLGQNNLIDEVLIRWPDGQWTEVEGAIVNTTNVINRKRTKIIDEPTETNQFLLSESKDHPLKHMHQENEYDDFKREILIPHKQSENGPYIATGDVNNDKLEDIFIGGAAGYSGVLYLQQPNGSFRKSSDQAWVSDKESEDLGSVFFDVDNDNDLDLYVVSGGAKFAEGDPLLQDRIYYNDGHGFFTKGSLPDKKISGQCVVAADYDSDGDKDLFIGGRLVPGKYPTPADSYLLLNESGTFKDITLSNAPELMKLGMVTDAEFSDYDGDLDLDLIIVGEWMEITIMENTDGVFKKKTDIIDSQNEKGMWWSIAPGDFDKDGDIDYIVGNLGDNNKFKASKENPFYVYSYDFDENGTNDIVLAKNYDNRIVPVRGRECSSEQMPFIAEKFPTFEGFANAGLEDILNEEKLELATKYKISSFKSIFLKNEGGKFRSIPLPVEAQFSPLRDLLILDLNNDGNLDLLGVGNLYGTEVETIRYDAGVGLCLLGDGNGDFTPLSLNKSGFYSPHDARSIVLLNYNRILIGNNQGEVQVYNRD